MLGGYYTSLEVRCQVNFWGCRRVISLDRITGFGWILSLVERVAGVDFWAKKGGWRDENARKFEKD